MRNIEYHSRKAFQGKRVAAYARVSIENNALEHSLSAQTAHFNASIRQQAEWRFVDVYADSFISGTEIVRREEFNRLLDDCEQGKIDLVLCKSISRFARNTVDLLKTIRRLNELNIEVYFEKENLSTFSSEGELLLTLLACFAQEESRTISENVKWGIRKTYRDGAAKIRNKTVFGYRFNGGRYEIQEDEAQTVRLIFESYINKMPLREISAMLKKRGLKTTRGCDFSCSQIGYIIANEIYIGNIVLQKTFVKDFLKHTKVPNRGELPQYTLCGCHAPIISEEIFEAARAESIRRSATKKSHGFSGRIVCSKCGKPFTRRSNNGKYACWHCRNCSNIKLGEDKLKTLLGLSDEEIPQQIIRITAFENGGLDIEFYDGRREKWNFK